MPSTSGPTPELTTHGSEVVACHDAFTLTDIQLFHRFTSVTCHYLANPNKSSPWLDEIPAMSTKHPFLLHEIMALAAVDMSRDVAGSQDASTAYLEVARNHHAKALAGLLPAITANSPDLVAPVWACNSLFVPYYFATTADVASLLFTPEPHPGPAEWMLPLRGGVTIWKSNEKVLLDGKMGLHLKPYQQNLQEALVLMEPSSNPSEAVLLHMIEQLQMGGYDDNERRVMTETFGILRHCFRVSDRDDALAKKTASLTFCAVVPREFFEMLGRKRRAPLVVMAFWCVLLHRAEKGNWWMSFKTDRLSEMLAFIAESLGPEGRELISWPLEQMLGSSRDYLGNPRTPSG
ncbi:transcription factor [Gnomoniopsis sp. IMI 355080]|nr:transcription factor [Gnomoniopsis sp. IMI 355080]